MVNIDKSAFTSMFTFLHPRSFVFLSHLTSAHSCVYVFVHVCISSMLPQRENLLGSKRQVNNHYFACLLSFNEDIEITINESFSFSLLCRFR